MPYFIVLWFVIGIGIVRANFNETKRDHQIVKLFEQTKKGYTTYLVLTNKGVN